MKAISEWQPYGTLIVIEAKKIETRHWKTDYRGWIIIHAAKRCDDETASVCSIPVYSDTLYRAGYRRLSDLPFGAILGFAYLHDCKPTTSRPETQEWIPPRDSHEYQFGNYDEHRYGWIFTAAYKLPEPIPYRGSQGIFDIPQNAFGKDFILISQELDARHPKRLPPFQPSDLFMPMEDIRHDAPPHTVLSDRLGTDR